MQGRQDNQADMRDRRGATGVAYGLVVGLIAIVALGAISTSGEAINNLFTKTDDTLTAVVDGTATVAPSASPLPEGVDSFDFADVTAVSSNALIVTEAITLSGNFSNLTATPSGNPGSSAQIRVNGGSWVYSGTVNPGDTLEMRMLAATAAGAVQVMQVEIGGLTVDWQITTRTACGGNRCIFLTSTTHNGNLGGALGADAICQSKADNVGLNGTFFAYLSEGNPGLSSADRFNWNGPYYNLNGGQASSSYWPYTSGWLSNGLTDENGVAITSSLEFWANGSASGNYCGPGNAASGSQDNCGQFTTSNSGNDAITGSYNGSNVTHLCSYWRSCANSYRLLCVEK